MPIFLKTRAEDLLELMDEDDCDLVLLNNTYAQFARINALLSLWKRIYKRYIFPLKPKTLLDIGCGGGDVARSIAHWAKQDGLNLDITAVDPDERALSFARQQNNPNNLRFCAFHAEDLVKEGQSFDVVISNHVLHHLKDVQLTAFCTTSAALANQRVIHNDIRRADLAYLSFHALSPFFQNSFIMTDGLRSIRRSFTPSELSEIAPISWQVKPLFPFRNLLLYTPESAS